MSINVTFLDIQQQMIKMRFNSKKGLTLIEALIWFAVFAAVVAGVFGLYSSSRNSSMLLDANKEIATIFTKANSLYASEGTASFGLNESSAGLDITPTLFNMGILPKTLKWNGTSLYNRFGGDVKVFNRTQGFVLIYSKIPTGSMCSNIISNQRKIGWDFVVIGASNRVMYDSTYNVDSVANLCKGEGGVAAGTIPLQFASCIGC
jgi:hypothetical protein